MIEALLPYKKCQNDIIDFSTEEQVGQISVQTFQYNEPAEKIGGSELGDEYTIVCCHRSDIKTLDRFDAILIDPLEYVSQIIPKGFRGFILRRTTKSEQFVQQIFDNLPDLA